MTLHSYEFHFSNYCISSERSNEPYGDWSEEYSNSLEYITKVEEYGDINSIHDLKDGDKAYAVWVEYSTGNSFGWATNGSVEAVGVFKDKESAEAYKKYLEDTDGGIEWGIAIDFVAPDGQVFKEKYRPWNGYFERLSEVYVTLVVIDGDK